MNGEKESIIIKTESYREGSDAVVKQHRFWAWASKNGEKFKTIDLVAKNDVTSKFAFLTENTFFKLSFAF